VKCLARIAQAGRDQRPGLELKYSFQVKVRCRDPTSHSSFFQQSVPRCPSAQAAKKLERARLR